MICEVVLCSMLSTLLISRKLTDSLRLLWFDIFFIKGVDPANIPGKIFATGNFRLDRFINIDCTKTGKCCLAR